MGSVVVTALAIHGHSNGNGHGHGRGFEHGHCKDHGNVAAFSPNRACDVGVLADLVESWWSGVTAGQLPDIFKTIEKHGGFGHFLSKNCKNTRF